MALTLADIARILKAGASGLVGGAVGWPMDTAVGAANLGRAAYGYGGSKLGLLKPDQMPELIDNANIPGTSDYISRKMEIGDTPGEEIAQFVGGMLAPGPKGSKKPPRSNLTTYHASPYKFDKFDMSKVGTGEGAQAFSHGIYLAEHPDVARGYHRALAGDEFLVGGNAVGHTRAPLSPEAHAATLIQDYGDVATARRRAQQLVDNMYWPPKQGESVIAALDDVAKKGVTTRQGGAVYKVDLPDEHIGKMIDWDTALGQQQHVMQSLGAKLQELGLSHENTGEDLLKALGATSGGDKAREASRMLLESGIPGTKYFDRDSRSAGKGTRNFVIYDDQLAKILGVE